MTEFDINQQVAEQIARLARWEGRDFHPGECVALLDGKVVSVANDLASALRALRAADPDPHRGVIFEVGAAVIDIIR